MSQSLVFHSHHWQLMCRWFQCLTYNASPLPMYSKVLCLSSWFPWLLGLRTAILFLILNCHSQLLPSMSYSIGFNHRGLLKRHNVQYGKMCSQGALGVQSAQEVDFREHQGQMRASLCAHLSRNKACRRLQPKRKPAHLKTRWLKIPTLDPGICLAPPQSCLTSFVPNPPSIHDWAWELKALRRLRWMEELSDFSGYRVLPTRCS